MLNSRLILIGFALRFLSLFLTFFVLTACYH